MPLTAIVPAAGRGLKPYPAWDTVEKLMHPVIDRDGIAKPVLQIIADDLLGGGVERIVLVVRPGEERIYRQEIREVADILERTTVGSGPQQALGRRLLELLDHLSFAVQDEPLGFGHALWCAREMVSGDRFILTLSDHLFLSRNGKTCTQQMVEAVAGWAHAVSSVESLFEHELRRYGVVGARALHGVPGTWEVQRVMEKPTPTQAELELETPGLRRGRYLCFSGLHVLPVDVMDVLDERVRERTRPDWMELSPVLDDLARDERLRAIELDGRHQDIGTAYGLLEAQVERALLGPDRDRVLNRFVGLLARCSCSDAAEIARR